MEIEKELKGEVKFMLIVEKESIYSRLKALGFHKKYKCVVTTPKGQTRVVAWKLREHQRVPFYGMVDLNAHGFVVICAFKFGTKIKLSTI